MTNASSQRFLQLLDGYLRQSLTQDELTEFIGLVRLGENQSLLEEAVDQDFRQAVVDVTNPRQAEAAFQVLAEKAGISLHTQEQKIKRINPAWRWMAAAAVLILAGGVAYLTGGRNEKSGITVTAPRADADVKPGHNGAVLHLSNGNTIVLDSVQDGIVATQGSVQAVKVNGELKYVGKAAEVLYNTVTTDRGRQWQLTLPDGTKVWLNAASSIRFPTSFAGKERLVYMCGEAYFEVTKNPSMPFHVKVLNVKDQETSAGDIRVLGTDFNVNAYADEEQLKATLLEGSIELKKSDKLFKLNPGEQAEIIYVTDQVKITKAADPQQAIAWKNGFFQFDQADLKTVMRAISRWYNVNVEYQGTVPVQRFGGKIQRDLTLNELLDVLAKSQVHFKIDGTTLKVMP